MFKCEKHDTTTILVMCVFLKISKIRTPKFFQKQYETLKFLNKKIRSLPIPACGTLVDGLQHDFHTEAVGKPDRLGFAQNNTPIQNLFCLIIDKKTLRIYCSEYIEDLRLYIEGGIGNASAGSMIFLNF